MRSSILFIFLIVMSSAMSNLPPSRFKRMFQMFGYKTEQKFDQNSPCANLLSTTPAPVPLLCRVNYGSGSSKPPSLPSNFYPSPEAAGGVLVGLGKFLPPTQIPPTQKPVIKIGGPTLVRPQWIPEEASKSPQIESGGFIEPFIPPGFRYTNPSMAQPEKKCPLSARPDRPLCSTMDTLDQLQLRKIYGYIVKSGLEPLFQATSNYTFFAPADPAFSSLPEWFLSSLDMDMKLLRALILNHFIKVDAPLHTLGNDFLILNARPGGNRIRSNVYFPQLPYRAYTMDGSQVLLGDLLTRTGRLNIVNKVILPNPRRNVAQYLRDISEFSEFLGMVEEAKMIDLLEGSDPITVFIPSNEAFKIFDRKVLQGNETAMKNFVMYHIVHGAWYSNGLMDGQHLTTLLNKEVKLSVTSDGFSKILDRVNNENHVLKADISLLNGVAHVVSGVLSTVPEFYLYDYLTEFSTLNFGTLKRRHSIVSENKI